MEQCIQSYIGGLWTTGAGQGSIDVFSPTDGALLTAIRQGNAADADKAGTAGFHGLKLPS